MPPRVAFCITDLDPGGAERALVQLLANWDFDRWTPKVYCLGPEAELTATIRQLGVAVEHYGARSRWDWGVLGWLTRQLRADPVDVLQCLMFHANLVGRFAGRRARVPVIIAGHRVAERQHRWHLAGERWTRNWVDHHVCVSQGVAEHVQQWMRVAPSYITVIPNGVHVAAAPHRVRDASSSPTVLSVGRLHPQKGFLFLLDAWEQVLQEAPDAKLWIAGEGPQRAELEARRGRLSRPESVSLLGYRRDVPTLMQQADLFACTSVWEGMSNAVLEAMAAGLPVVALPAEGMAELLRPEETGVLVQPATGKDFAQAVLRLWRSTELRSRLGKQSQAYVAECFAPQECARRYAELFDALRVACNSIPGAPPA